MKKIVLCFLIVLAAVSMVFPTGTKSMTEMAFAPGTPDPNLHRTVLEFGWPGQWIGFQRDRRESDGLDKIKMTEFSLPAFVIHIAAIAIPVWFLLRIRGRTRKEMGNRAD